MNLNISLMILLKWILSIHKINVIFFFYFSFYCESYLGGNLVSINKSLYLILSFKWLL